MRYTWSAYDRSWSSLIVKTIIWSSHSMDWIGLDFTTFIGQFNKFESGKAILSGPVHPKRPGRGWSTWSSFTVHNQQPLKLWSAHRTYKMHIRILPFLSIFILCIPLYHKKKKDPTSNHNHRLEKHMGLAPIKKNK